MAYWKLRIGDVFMLDRATWTVIQRRDTMIYVEEGARELDGSRSLLLLPHHSSKKFYLYRVLRDAQLLKPGPPPTVPLHLPGGEGLEVTIEQVDRNRDRPKSVRHDADLAHVCVTFCRPKGGTIWPTGNWEYKHFFFALPTGSELPNVEEALDAIVADAIEWEDIGWVGAPSPDAWASEHGYVAGGAEAQLAIKFIHKRSRRLRGLGSQDLYHDLLWKTARLPNNRWGTLLTVTGQIPPARK